MNPNYNNRNYNSKGFRGYRGRGRRGGRGGRGGNNNYYNNKYEEVEISYPSNNNNINNNSNNNNYNNNNNFNNNYNYNNNYNNNNNQGIEIEYVDSKKNKKKSKKNYNNNNYNNNAKEIDIEDAPKEIYDNYKGKGKLIEKEITDEDFKKKYNDDLLDDVHDDYVKQNKFEYYDNKLDDENDEDIYDEDDDYNDNYNNNNYYNETSTNTSQSSYKNQKYKNPLTFTDSSGFTQKVDSIVKNSPNQNYYHADITDSFVNVLMIAEKPSIAKMISEVLSNGKYKNHRMGKGKCLLTFDGFFKNVRARFTVSAVAGHVYTSDFMREHNRWDNIEPVELYNVPIVKLDAMKKMHMPELIQKLSTGKDILCLWLDCDSEGENICYEVIYNAFPYMNKKKYQQIYRAKFSSLTKKDLKYAFENLSEPPNKNESMSVDCRQVIDLKIGVSFTRFLTSSILPGIEGLSEANKILSYGPCQTPTLWFCVNRQKEIKEFKSQQFYRFYVELEINHSKERIYYNKKFFKRKEVENLMEKAKQVKSAKIKDVIINSNSNPSPPGLNTVNLLRVASSYLKLSPHNTMVIAEKLYTLGYITYPRTETTRYSPSFDFEGNLKNFENHPTFGSNVKKLLYNFKKPTLKGYNAGDHPPITPSKYATNQQLSGDQWRLYEFICTHFFASLSPNIEYDNIQYKIDVNGIEFEETSNKITNQGYLLFFPHRRKNFEKDFPIIEKNSELNILNINYTEGWTEAPDYLTESDLISEMEKNRIGTDASMPVHIENICQRGYVTVDEKRRLIPTKLGNALIDSLGCVDSEIIHPENRAKIEDFVNQVSQGKKNYDEVLKYALELYKEKFIIIRVNYDKLLNSFRKYFKFNDNLIREAAKKIRDQNNIYKESKQKQKSESEVTTDINTCDECKKGKMYIEYDQFDKFCLFCTNCKRRDKLIRDALKIEVNKNLKCQKCGSFYVDVEVENPFLNGDRTYTGCLMCDPALS